MAQVLAAAMGVVAIVASSSATEMARIETNREIESLGTRLLVIDGVTETQTLPVDAKERLERLVNLDTVGTMRRLAVEVTASLDPSDQRLAGSTVVEVDTTLRDVLNLRMSAGRWFDPVDQGRAVVVSEEAASAMGLTRLGENYLFLDGQRLPVVGVVAGAERFGESEDIVLLPRDVVDRSDPPMRVFALFAWGDMTRSEELVGRLLADGGPPPLVRSSEDLIAVATLVDTRLQSASVMVAGLVLMMTTIGGAALGIMTVRTQSGEIGIARALGRTRSDLVAQFLLNGFLLGAAGAVLGSSLGVWLSGILAIANTWEPAISWPSVAIGASAAAATGLLASAAPAYMAARLLPRDALRR